MRTEMFDLELITPCFCAGADQTVAEIRPASVKGQLRWWFRALGGGKEDESLIFGSAAGDSGRASRVRIRVSPTGSPAPWTPPSYLPNEAPSYVWHYASVSGTTVKGAKGPRWQRQGALPAGTTFKIHVTWLREMPNLKPAFDEALFVFLTLGALGLRATRGLGAFHCKQATEMDKVIALLERKSFTIKRRTNPNDFGDYSAALKDWASWLRYKLRKNHKAEHPSALGSSDPRQASAVHFRPFRYNDRVSWLAFELPANRVLGTESRRNSPLLANYSFSGPAPTPEPRIRRY